MYPIEEAHPTSPPQDIVAVYASGKDAVLQQVDFVSHIEESSQSAVCAVAVDSAVNVDVALAAKQSAALQVGYKTRELLACLDCASDSEVLHGSRHVAEEAGEVSAARECDGDGVACSVEGAAIGLVGSYHRGGIVGEVDVGLQHSMKIRLPCIDAICEVRQFFSCSNLYRLMLLFVGWACVYLVVEPRDAVLDIFLYPSHLDVI